MTLIKGGLVYDGTGKIPFEADILIGGGKILEVGNVCTAEGPRIIDASGLSVSPGFIDIHGHSDLEILRDPMMKAKVNQAITTELGGNCGIGVFPAADPTLVPRGLINDILGPYPELTFKDYNCYKSKINSPYSLFMLQSHSMLRFSAIKGNPNREATDKEISIMENLLETSLNQGCMGLSMGLYYAPCLFASREELVRLARIVSRHNKLLCVHHRCEGSDIIHSLREIISIAEETDVRLQISHLKIIGMKNQHLLDEVFNIIGSHGFDQYPYEYGSTSLSSLLPPDILSLSGQGIRKALKDPLTREHAIKEMSRPEGWDSICDLVGFENIYITELSHYPEYTDLSLATIGELRHQSPYESLLDILSRETGTALMIDVTQSRDSLKRIFNHPNGVFGTDALYTGSKGHPRSYNAANHILQKEFLSEMGCTTEFAIHRMTGKTAKVLGLTDRGLIAPGMRADLVIFDSQKIADKSTMRDPAIKPVGIKSVLIAGEEQNYSV